MKRLMFALPFIVLGACAQDEAFDTTSSALTVEQCTYFAEQGEGAVTFCHATASAKNPFVIITTDEEGCINGHEGHPNDKISLDGTCKDGCFPPGAPIDESRGEKCCEGTKADNGWCVEACPDKPCMKAKFYVEKGECFYEPADKGTWCDDGDAATEKSYCDGEGKCISDEKPTDECVTFAQSQTDSSFNFCFYEQKNYDYCVELGKVQYDGYYKKCTGNNDAPPTGWIVPQIQRQ